MKFESKCREMSAYSFVLVWEILGEADFFRVARTELALSAGERISEKQRFEKEYSLVHVQIPST